MLYHLASYMYHDLGLSWARLFTYVSFRAGVAAIIAILIATLLGKRIIRLLQRRQIGEGIRDLGLEGQMQKKGTPTMGGIIIILAIFVPTILLVRLDNVYILLMLVTLFLMGGLGFLDDYLKIKYKNKDGLNGWYKIAGQVLLGLIVGLTLILSPSVVIKENSEILKEGSMREVRFNTTETKATKTTVPFFKENSLDYSKILPFDDPDVQHLAGFILVVGMTIFIVTMLSNSVNLTDGIDGLASGSSAIVGAVLAVLAYVSSHIELAGYLNIMFIPGTEELSIFACIFVGATLGFLWYNSFPAQVFMGDTGSLMLGGVISVFAILIRKELMLVILCGVFILEGISVIVQRLYFKYTKHKTGKGMRVIRMAPLHHHYQKGGDSGIECLYNKPYRALPEAKITMRFFLIGIILAVLTLVTLKIR